MTAIPTDLPAQIDVPQRGLFPYAKYLAGALLVSGVCFRLGRGTFFQVPGG